MFRAGITFVGSSAKSYTSPFTLAQRTATKKAGGTVVNKADSPGQRLGVKKFGGERVYSQNILIRQKGLKWRPGINVYRARDFTLHAKTDGYVHFFKIPIPGKTRGRYKTYINVLPTRERDEDALVAYAAQVTKKAIESVEYRQGQKDFMRQMRIQHGPFIQRDEFIVDKGKQRILSRVNESV
eukprot:UN00010